MDIEIIREKTTPEKVREHAEATFVDMVKVVGNSMTYHQTLTAERWATFSFATQLINISSEIARAQSFERKHDEEHRRVSIAGALELLDFSINGSTAPSRRRELARLREMLLGIFLHDKSVPMTLRDVQGELEPFAFVCARERGV